MPGWQRNRDLQVGYGRARPFPVRVWHSIGASTPRRVATFGWAPDSRECSPAALRRLASLTAYKRAGTIAPALGHRGEGGSNSYGRPSLSAGGHRHKRDERPGPKRASRRVGGGETLREERAPGARGRPAKGAPFASTRKRDDVARRRLGVGQCSGQRRVQESSAGVPAIRVAYAALDSEHASQSIYLAVCVAELVL
jgi:hypothetical protein